MRWKTTFILFIAAFALGTYISLYELKQPTKEEEMLLKRRILRVSPEEVLEISIESPQAGQLMIGRHLDSWTIIKPISSKADDSLLQAILDELKPLEAKQILRPEAGKEMALEDFGLSPSVASISIKSRSSTKKIILGESTAVGSLRYAKLEDDDRVFVVRPALFDAINRPFDSFRSRSLLDFDASTVEKITVSGKDRSYSLSKQQPGIWKITEPFTDYADSSAVSNILGSLDKIKIERFISELPSPEQIESCGLSSPYATVEIKRSDKETPISISIGSKMTDEEALRYANSIEENRIVAILESGLEQILKNATMLRSLKIFNFSVNRVKKLHIEKRPEGLSIEQDQENWIDTEKKENLNPEKVEELLWKLKDLTASGFVQDKPNESSRYGLDQPYAEIQIWDSENQEPVSLLISNMTGKSGGRYAVVSKRDAILELTTSIDEILSQDLESLKKKLGVDSSEVNKTR